MQHRLALGRLGVGAGDHLQLPPRGAGPDPETPEGEPGLQTAISASDFLLGVPTAGLVALGGRSGLETRVALLAAGQVAPVERRRGRDESNQATRPKMIDVARLVKVGELCQGDAVPGLLAALDWPDDLVPVRVRVLATDDGSAKPSEVARALLGDHEPAGLRYARLGLLGLAGDGGVIDPLDLGAVRAALRRAPAERAAEGVAAETASA
jgi:hypothetical protein